tara:strand:- start:168 stop:278 length:111 start_codon:yes stop_codon:yes gene_type:complete
MPNKGTKSGQQDPAEQIQPRVKERQIGDVHRQQHQR